MRERVPHPHPDPLPLRGRGGRFATLAPGGGDEPAQRFAHNIREGPPFRKGDRAERFVLLSLDCREERHRLRKSRLAGQSELRGFPRHRLRRTRGKRYDGMP